MQRFVEHLMAQLQSPEDEVDTRYSETRSLNLTLEGEPAVEADAMATKTVTKVRREGDDFESAASVRTKTEAKPESDDFGEAVALSPYALSWIARHGKTKTLVEREGDDWAQL